MKPWKRDLAYIREVGPDEPRFDAAVQRVWDRCEELEAALQEIAEMPGRGKAGTGEMGWLTTHERAPERAREALS